MGKAQKSAGILLYRKQGVAVSYFLVHPGGPYWANKDLGAWSMPKGEFDVENPETAARREFREETGSDVTVPLFSLGTEKTKSGKTIFAFAGEQDVDALQVRSNKFPLEWPPRSGKKIMVPEVDSGEWFDFENASLKINPAQLPFLIRLRDVITRGK